MKYRINLYEQIDAFYEMRMGGELEVKATTADIYIYLLKKCNRAKWAHFIKFRDEEAILHNLGTKNTVRAAIVEMVAAGLVEIEKKANQKKAYSIHIKALKRHQKKVSNFDIYLDTFIATLPDTLLDTLPDTFLDTLSATLADSVYRHARVTDNSNNKVNYNNITVASFLGFSLPDKPKDNEAPSKSTEQNNAVPNYRLRIEDLEIATHTDRPENMAYVQFCKIYHEDARLRHPKSYPLKMAVLSDWLSPVKELIEVKGVTFEDLGDVTQYAIEDKDFWRPIVQTVPILCNSFFKIQEQMIAKKQKQTG